MPTMRFKEVMELLKGTKKEKLLFRKEVMPELLFEKGNKPDRASVGVLEPKGLYMVEGGRKGDLPDLINPGWTKRHKVEEGKEFGTYARMMSGRRSFERKGLTTKAQENPWLMVGALKEGEKVLDLSNPEQYRRFLLNEVERYVEKEKAVGTYLKSSPAEMRQGIINSTGGQGLLLEGSKIWEDLENFPEHIANTVREKGYAAVKVPDVVVRQPERVQTVVVKPGVLAARQGKWAGMLGLGGVAVGATLIGSEENAQAHLEMPKMAGGYRASDTTTVSLPKSYYESQFGQNIGKEGSSYKASDFLADVRNIIPELDLLAKELVSSDFGGFEDKVKGAYDEAKAKGVSTLSQFAIRAGTAPVRLAHSIFDLALGGFKKAKEGGSTLLGGPRGEGGEWTPEQVEKGQNAFLTAVDMLVGGFPGGGTGPANIGKKVAIKQLSKAFRERKNWIAGMLEAAGRIESPLKLKSAELEAAQLERNFPIITKSIRRQPQELLDPIQEVGLKTRIGARGQFDPITMRADWSVEKGINITPSSIPHEALHGVDVAKYSYTGNWTEDLNRKVPPAGYFEARAYPFGDKMEKAMAELPKEGKISKETYEDILAQVEKEVIDKWGPNLFDYDTKKVLEYEFGKKSLPFSKTEALFELDSSKPGFFSKLEEAVPLLDFGKKAGAKLDIGQIKGFFRGKQVSETEIKNILGSVEGKVSKDELMREIAINKTEFEDVVFDRKLPEGDISTAEMAQYNFPKFSTYQEPGAVEGSYKELFVTDPKATKTPVDESFENLVAGKSKIPVDFYKDSFMWSDGHISYSDIQNPIVRIRYNDRITPEGKKILFIEEMQGPTGDTKYEVTSGAGKGISETFTTKAAAEKYYNTYKTRDWLSPVKKVIEGEQGEMPPHLQSRIYDIGVKKALILAKEGGYEGVAWTTGEMQAKRYDLSKQIDSIFANRLPDGRYDIQIRPKGGPVFKSIGSSVDPDQVEQYVGKEAASKILGNSKKETILEGLDLQVGGEGLKKVYNKTLPEKFKQYGKGAVIETTIYPKIDQFGRELGPKQQVPFFKLNKNTPSRYSLLTLPPAALALNELMNISTSNEEN